MGFCRGGGSGCFLVLKGRERGGCGSVSSSLAPFAERGISLFLIVRCVMFSLVVVVVCLHSRAVLEKTQ